MVKVYMKDKTGKTTHIELSENEKLLILSREAVEKNKIGVDLPDEVADAIMQYIGKNREGPVAFKIKYNEDEDTYTVETVDRPLIDIPRGAIYITKNSIGWSKDTKVRFIDDHVLAVELEGGTRIGVGDKAKDIIERADKPRVILDIEQPNFDAKKSLSLEPGKTYYIGRLAEGIAKTGQYNPKAVYVYDEDGNVYGLLGYSDKVSVKHLKLSVTEDGRVIVEDHGVKGKGSLFGTLVNGKVLRPEDKHELREGDTIVLGERGLAIKVHSITPVNITVEEKEKEREEEEHTVYDTVVDEEQLISENTGKPLKTEEEIRKEVESVFKPLVENTSVPAETLEADKALDEVQEVGGNIEKEVIESIAPITGTGLRPVESMSWYMFLRKTNKLIKDKAIVPGDNEVRDAVHTLRYELAGIIAEHIKSTRLYVNGEEKAMPEALGIDDEEIGRLATRLADRLVDDNGFIEIVGAGISQIRYGLSMLPEKRDLYLSYRHAIRLNGYVTSLVLEELSDRVSTNTQFLEKFRENLVLKSVQDRKQVMDSIAPITSNAPSAEATAKKKEHAEEEELVSS